MAAKELPQIRVCVCVQTRFVNTLHIVLRLGRAQILCRVALHSLVLSTLALHVKDVGRSVMRMRMMMGCWCDFIVTNRFLKTNLASGTGLLLLCF